MDNKGASIYNDEYLTVSEFALLLRVSKRTIFRAIKNGKLQAVNIGQGVNKYWRIPKSEINRIAVFDLRNLINNIMEDECNGVDGV